MDSGHVIWRSSLWAGHPSPAQEQPGLCLDVASIASAGHGRAQVLEALQELLEVRASQGINFNRPAGANRRCARHVPKQGYLPEIVVFGEGRHLGLSAPPAPGADLRFSLLENVEPI